MQFASKTPRDLNRDPRPYRHDYNTARVKHYIAGQEALGWKHDPRPEYDHPQHNKPNPILTEFRELHARTGNALYADAYMFSSEMLDNPEAYDPEQLTHAYLVLSRVWCIAKSK